MSTKIYNTHLVRGISINPPLQESRPSLPDHFNYMSGPRAELFHALVKRGILDEYGKITSDYAHKLLPQLEQKELSIISEELDRPFKIRVDQVEIEISMNEILDAFSQNKPPWVVISSTQLIGGFVFYLLLSETNYTQRVFDDLNIRDLYKNSLLPRHKKKPSDIDLRMHIERVRGFDSSGIFQCAISPQDLNQLSKNVIQQLAHKFAKKQIPFLEEKIRQQAFEGFCTIATPHILMLLISLKKTPFDWILSSRLLRDYVFTVDDLYLPLGPSVRPASHRNKPVESFFHCLLGFTDTENISTIDNKGWLRYQTLLVRGNYCIYKDLEADLFSKMKNKGSQPFKLELQATLEKWTKKHLAQDPLAALTLILNISLHLQGRLPDFEIDDFLRTELLKISIKSSNSPLFFVKELISGKNVSLRNLASILKIAAFQIHARKSPQLEEIQVEMVTYAFQRPVIQLKIDSYTIQLNIQILQELKEIRDISSDLHQDLAKLFFQICPPTEHQEVRSEEFFNNLGLDLKALTDSSRALANEDHPFLRYLGLSLLYPNPIVDPTIKRKSAERILLSTLNFVKEKEKEAFLSEFNRFIGKDAIPSLSSDFFKNWIYTLFAYGRESEEVAIKVLKEHPPQAFSFQLIPELATRRPGYALQLFMTMNLRDFPNEAFSSILACGRIVHELRTKTLEHDSLIKFMSAKIPELLDHKEHKKPKNAKKLSSNLYLFVEYDPSTEIARKGLELGYFNDKEKEACNRLLCLPGLESAFKSPSCSLFKERLKEALIKNLLSEADQLHYLLKFYNDRPDDNDPLLFSNFIKLDCASIRNDEQKIEFLEALSTLLKVRSFKKKQSEKKQIELILERLKDYIPLLSSCRDLFIRCYTLNIKLPRSLQEIWYKTLLLWIKDENPDYLKIYDLLIEGEKRNFALDRFSAEVMLILSEKWKNKAAHSNRLFLLLQKIALLSPMIENKGRLYDLFIDLLKTKERYLPLINTFAEEEPLPPYKQIIESVLILLHTSQNDNAKFKFVVNWFITTPFFQPIKGDNQLNKLIQEIIQLILKRGYSNKDDWNTTLYELVAAYVEEMRSMEDKVWEPLINYFQKTKNIKTIDLYYLVDKEGLLAEDRFPFFLLCACAICLMKDNKDPRFLEIMQNPNKYIEICMKSNQPILFLISNIAFIESATTFHYFFKENPRIKDHIIEIYTLSRKMYSEVQPQVELLKDPDKEKQSEILNYIDPGLDLAFLEFFYKIELFSEASNHLDTILSSPHTDNYWKSFGNFINILLSTTNPELIVDDIDKILDTTKILYADNIDLKSLINLLMKFSISDSTDFEKKIKRYKTAAFFLESALRYKSLPPNHAIWGHYFSLIDFFNEANEHERAEILIKSLELNLSSVGEDFLSQAYESSLHQWEENSEPNNLSELISQNLDLISKYTYGEEDFIKLFTYFKVLDKFSRLSKSNFLYILDLFKKTFEIGSKTKKTSSRKVSLPKEGYFQLISLLIEILSLEIKDRSHPFPELIEQQIQEYLDVLINRFPEYPYIDRLNHLFFHSFESILYRWSLNVNDRDKDRLLWYLYDWIRNLPGMNAEGNEKFSIFISLFFFGLERVSLIDEEEFSKVLNAFVSILEVRSKQEEKSEYKLYLKENEYFNIKILLIRNLLNVAGKDQPEHPFLKTVELEIKKHLGILMKEFRKVDYSRLLQEFKLIQQRRSTDQE